MVFFLKPQRTLRANSGIESCELLRPAQSSGLLRRGEMPEDAYAPLNFDHASLAGRDAHAGLDRREFRSLGVSLPQ